MKLISILKAPMYNS